MTPRYCGAHELGRRPRRVARGGGPRRGSAAAPLAAGGGPLLRAALAADAAAGGDRPRRDDADLLRERRPAHRARQTRAVATRSALRAARRAADALRDRDGRARPEGAGVGREPWRRAVRVRDDRLGALPRARRRVRRVVRPLHPYDRRRPQARGRRALAAARRARPDLPRQLRGLVLRARRVLLQRLGARARRGDGRARRADGRGGRVDGERAVVLLQALRVDAAAARPLRRAPRRDRAARRNEVVASSSARGCATSRPARAPWGVGVPDDDDHVVCVSAAAAAAFSARVGTARRAPSSRFPRDAPPPPRAGFRSYPQRYVWIGALTNYLTAPPRRRDRRGRRRGV